MAEELKKKREDVAGYLQQMVDYTKQGKVKEAKEIYNILNQQERFGGLLDHNSRRKLEKIKAYVGSKGLSVYVVKGAIGVLRSYEKYIHKEIKKLEKERAKLEKEEEKFKKLRKKLEK